jgi:hypothetical protein
LSVAVHRTRFASAASFDAFIAALENERLLDKRLLGQRYTPELIGSDRARAQFAAPNLRALPALA